MKRMTTLKDHERRITALEDIARDVKDILTAHGKTFYELKRFKTKTDLRFDKLFKHFNIEDISEEQVDEVLDAE